MIEYVKITNYPGEEERSESIVVNVKDTPTVPDHGLIIKEITGLGQLNANVNTSAYAITDGSYLSTVRAENRNIVMKFILTESYNGEDTIGNIEQSRLRLYRMFPLKKKVLLNFKTDTSAYTKWIEGYVENTEPDIFSEQEEVSVSIICISPYFKMSKAVGVGNSKIFSYDGNIDAGCIIRYRPNSKGASITINGISLDVDKINQLIGTNYNVNGQIVISSVPGNKFIEYWTDGGAQYNILYAAGIGPYDWMILKNGTNEIRVMENGADAPSTQFGDEDQYVIGDINPGDLFATSNLVIEYDELYGGI